MSRNPASKKHLRRLAEMGIIQRAVEFVNALVIAASIVLFVLFVPTFFRTMQRVFQASWSVEQFTDASITAVLSRVLLDSYGAIFSYMGLVAVIAYLIHIAVSGVHFTPQQLQPKLSRLSIKSYASRIFSARSLVILFKIFVGYGLVIGVLAILVYQLVLADMAAHLNQVQSFLLLTKFSVFLLVSLVGIALLIGIVDFIMEYQRFRQQSMMSVHESREELKSEQVAPEVRRAINAQLKKMRSKRS